MITISVWLIDKVKNTLSNSLKIGTAYTAV